MAKHWDFTTFKNKPAVMTLEVGFDAEIYMV
jgi:hypothetical protein